jgi:2-polyprenyl-6-methoxyphenol hydroxylase-like FAD-dependent oxidoreductase
MKTGFGGLTAAIECHRQGHDVEIYESFPVLKPLGDIISFGSNAGRIFRRWGVDGAITNKMRELSIDLRKHGFRIHKYTGEHIITQATPEQNPDAPVFNGHRGELHEVVFNHAKDDLNIPIHLGCKIEKYLEEKDRAGVELDSGEKAGFSPEQNSKRLTLFRFSQISSLARTVFVRRLVNWS